MEITLPATRTAPSSTSVDAWSRALVGPDRARLLALTQDLPGDPSPRTLFGAALTLAVARAYGTRRWGGGERAAVAVVEGIDRRVFADVTTSTATWAREDAARLRRVWEAIFTNEVALLDRVLDRLVSGPVAFGEVALPEAVLFCRGAVAVGVLAGAVEDATHAVLDRVATGLGRMLEAGYGTSPSFAYDDGRAHLLAALSELPDGSFVERLTELADAVPRHLSDTRAFRGYQPRPVPRPSIPSDDPISAAMLDAFGAPGVPVQRAASWLVAQGGKRMRPALVLHAAAVCGGSTDAAVRPAALLEWLHQSSLVLDDILDEAKIRRGQPTLHHATDAPFAALTASYALARVAIASRGLAPAVRTALFDAASTLAEGQRAELEHTADDQLPLAVYYRVIEAKTARLFACAAALGARSVGAPKRQVAALERFGREAGLAFQIVDDVLDFFGDEAALGKRPGTDLRAGKVTLPLLLLRDALDPAGRETLAAVLRSEPSARRAAFPWVLDRMRALRIEEDALSRAHVHRQRAVDALAAFPESPARAALVALADRIVARSR